MVNVTDKVNAVVKAGMDEQQAMTARMTRLDKLRDGMNGRDGLLSGWVSLFKGGEYWIYLYKVHRDVRLVMAPESQIAFFGGDADNWTFPRHDMDFALFRVYEGGEPYHPPHYLRWAAESAKPGDFTFVAGNPSRTRRLETIAQMRHQRDVALPAQIAEDEAHRRALDEFGKLSEVQARKVVVEIFNIENRLKAAKGELAGLQDPRAFAELEKKESDLRAAVAQAPGLQAEAGASWTRIEEAVAGMKPFEQLQRLVNSRSSKLLRTALEVVRCAQELDRPVAERLDGYRTRDDVDYEKWRLESALTFDDAEIEAFLIAKGLEDIQTQLPADHPFRKAVLGDRSPAELAQEAVSGTKLTAMYVRRELIQQRSKGIAKSSDPLVKLARAMESFARDIDREEERLWDVAQDHAGRIARARFALHGKTLYPDATGTLRFSFGAIEGYPEEGKAVHPFTTFGDLYEKARVKGPEAANGAWALPKRWQERRGKLDPATPLNFCHSVDIVGGNSGSPTLNAKGEFTGLIFDGNLQSLPGKFYYDPQVNRAISVDSRAILEALVRVYDAKHLADELLQ